MLLPPSSSHDEVKAFTSLLSVIRGGGVIPRWSGSCSRDADYFASGCEHLNSTSHSSHRSPCSAAGSTDGDNFCSPTSCTVTNVALTRDKCKIRNCPVKSNSTFNILRIYASRSFSHNSNKHQDENHCSSKTISYVESSFIKTQMVYRSSGGCSCCCD